MVITCSDTRTTDTDTSGQLIMRLLKEQGHQVMAYYLVKDEPLLIKERIGEALRTEGIQAIIINGGTGISRRDSTFEAVDAMLEKRLDGFGELFRMLSYEQIGSAAILTRACAGTIGRTAVFSLPGSEHAVRLGVSKLILPELGHVVRELRR